MINTVQRVRRPPGLVRGALALAVAALAGGAVVPPATAAEGEVRASQPLVVLQSAHVARSRPSVRARSIETIARRRPLTGVRTVLPVLRTWRNDAGRNWLRVRLPGRPNGHAGWIAAERTTRAFTGWHIVLRRGTRRVVVHRYGRPVRRFRAVVGTSSTPTPRGRFFIEEAVALSPADLGGPYALATSARSEVLQEFAGGPGQIALHGTDGLPGALGSGSSHGCIRLSTRAITWLARRIGSGVPLTITR